MDNMDKQMELEMDALLEEDERDYRHQEGNGTDAEKPQISASLQAESSSLSSHSPTEHQAIRKMVVTTCLLVSSSVRAHQAAIAAAETRTLVFTLVVLQYATFSLILALYHWKTTRLGPGFGLGKGASWNSVFSRSDRWLDREEKRDAIVLGCLSAMVAGLSLWEARLVDPRLWQAAEVIIVPLLILAPTLSNALPSLPFGALHAISLTCPSTHSPRSSVQYIQTLAYILSAITFLVTFSFVAIAGLSWGVTFTLLRLPLEVLRWCLLRKYLINKGEKLPIFFLATAVYATATALAALLFSLLLPNNEHPHSIIRRAAVLRYFLSSVANTIFLLLTLKFFETSLTAASILVKRNLILLLMMSYGQHGITLSGNWIQVMWILTGGWLTLEFYDPVTSTVLRSVYRAVLSGGSSRPRSTKSSHQGSTGDEEEAERGQVRRASLEHFHHKEESASDICTDPQAPSVSIVSPGPNQHSQSHTSLTKKSNAHTVPTPSYINRWALLSLLPLVVCIFQSPASSSYTVSSIMRACALLPPRLRSSLCPTTGERTSRTIDLVFAYYEESLEVFRDHLIGLREEPFIQERDNRALVYNKGNKSEMELREALNLEAWDQVIKTDNLGREGGTYLRHIILNYNQTIAALTPSVFIPGGEYHKGNQRVGFADHTYFMQPHLAWHWIAKPRLGLMKPETGFAHFGPLHRSLCGVDEGINVDFPIVNQLFSIFRGELCSPKIGFLGAWSAQFAVSKQRILANPYQKYASLDALIEAPVGHWVHDMWGPNDSGGPTNPALGHSVERAWPFIFGCTDPNLASNCTDEVFSAELCQCMDVAD